MNTSDQDELVTSDNLMVAEDLMVAPAAPICGAIVPFPVGDPGEAQTQAQEA